MYFQTTPLVVWYTADANTAIDNLLIWSVFHVFCSQRVIAVMASFACTSNMQT